MGNGLLGGGMYFSVGEVPRKGFEGLETRCVKSAAEDFLCVFGTFLGVGSDFSPQAVENMV